MPVGPGPPDVGARLVVHAFRRGLGEPAVAATAAGTGPSAAGGMREH